MLSIVRSVGVCHLDSEKLHNARRMSLSEPSLYLLPCVSGVHSRLDNLNCHRRVASRQPPSSCYQNAEIIRFHSRSLNHLLLCHSMSLTLQPLPRSIQFEKADSQSQHKIRALMKNA